MMKHVTLSRIREQLLNAYASSYSLKVMYYLQTRSQYNATFQIKFGSYTTTANVNRG